MNYEEYESYNDIYDGEAIIEAALDIYDKYEVTMEEAVDIAMEVKSFGISGMIPENIGFDLGFKAGGKVGKKAGLAIGERKRKKSIDKVVKNEALRNQIDVGNGTYVIDKMDIYKKHGIDPKTRIRNAEKDTSDDAGKKRWDDNVRASEMGKALYGGVGSAVGGVAAGAVASSLAVKAYRDAMILAHADKIIEFGNLLTTKYTLRDEKNYTLNYALGVATNSKSSRKARLNSLKTIDRIVRKTVKGEDKRRYKRLTL